MRLPIDINNELGLHEIEISVRAFADSKFESLTVKSRNSGGNGRWASRARDFYTISGVRRDVHIISEVIRDVHTMCLEDVSTQRMPDCSACSPLLNINWMIVDQRNAVKITQSNEHRGRSPMRRSLAEIHLMCSVNRDGVSGDRHLIDFEFLNPRDLSISLNREFQVFRGDVAFRKTKSWRSMEVEAQVKEARVEYDHSAGSGLISILIPCSVEVIWDSRIFGYKTRE
jgi:hypothetical protein